jgi:hypothetical protein
MPQGKPRGAERRLGVGRRARPPGAGRQRKRARYNPELCLRVGHDSQGDARRLSPRLLLGAAGATVVWRRRCTRRKWHRRLLRRSAQRQGRDGPRWNLGDAAAGSAAHNCPGRLSPATRACQVAPSRVSPYLLEPSAETPAIVGGLGESRASRAGALVPCRVAATAPRVNPPARRPAARCRSEKARRGCRPAGAAARAPPRSCGRARTRGACRCRSSGRARRGRTGAGRG